jgi:uncharacterized membrane protein YczE
VLKAAARRFGVMLAAVAVTTFVVSLVLGVALGSTVSRSVSVGFYCVGSAILILGFFAGNRGPVRQKGEQGGGGFLLPLPGRMLRWASPVEQHESISLSAIFVSVGFVLIALGVAADNRYNLF